MGAAPPWGQSLLRSYLAPHSFPPPPPAYVLSALGTVVALVALTPKGVGVVAVDHRFGMWEVKIGSEGGGSASGEAPSSGGWGREGVRSTPKRGSPRGVGSEARAEQRLAAGGCKVHPAKRGSPNPEHVIGNRFG